MISILIILVILFFIFDMILTYRYVNSYKEMYPKNDWSLAEANLILRFFMKKFGLVDGVVYGGTIILFMLIITIRLLPDYYGMFLLGMYFMANVYHFVNWSALKRLKLQKLKGGKAN